MAELMFRRETVDLIKKTSALEAPLYQEDRETRVERGSLYELSTDLRFGTRSMRRVRDDRDGFTDQVEE